MLKMLEQWIFPFICSLCGQFSETDKDLCKLCYDSLSWINDRCYRCGEDLDAHAGSTLCERCTTEPLSFDRLCALFSYEPPLTQLISRFKFEGSLSEGRVLGELLKEKVDFWYRHQTLPDAFIPMPLHKKRLRKRGFNQALELSLAAHHYYKIPIILDACIRIRETPPQAERGEVERKQNMKNAFRVIKPIPFEHVAIIDDVVTTGSTVNALSSALKESGVEIVDVWCICRA